MTEQVRNFLLISEPMQGIALDNCEVGTVSSTKDGAVRFTVTTAELRPSERGMVMEYHGKACAVVVKPHDSPPDAMIVVDTERTASKTPSQRLRNVLFCVYRETKQTCTFDEFYAKQYEVIINTYKAQLP